MSGVTMYNIGNKLKSVHIIHTHAIVQQYFRISAETSYRNGNNTAKQRSTPTKAIFMTDAPMHKELKWS